MTELESSSYLGIWETEERFEKKKKRRKETRKMKKEKKGIGATCRKR